MFIIIYIIYKVVCFYNMIKHDLFSDRPVMSFLMLTVPCLFYISFAYGGLLPIAVLFGSLILYGVCFLLVINKSEALSKIIMINTIEWFTVCIPSYAMYLDNMVFFAPSDYELYFLGWKIFG